MLYVFESQNENFGSLAIKADSIEDAMEIVKDMWYPSYFLFDFSVTIITGTSGV